MWPTANVVFIYYLAAAIWSHFNFKILFVSFWHSKTDHDTFELLFQNLVIHSEGENPWLPHWSSMSIQSLCNNGSGLLRVRSIHSLMRATLKQAQLWRPYMPHLTFSTQRNKQVSWCIFNESLAEGVDLNHGQISNQWGAYQTPATKIPDQKSRVILKRKTCTISHCF